MNETQENKILRQIILDLLHYSDGCDCCINKGQDAPQCECMHDPECIEHMIELYRRNNDKVTNV